MSANDNTDPTNSNNPNENEVAPPGSQAVNHQNNSHDGDTLMNEPEEIDFSGMNATQMMQTMFQMFNQTMIKVNTVNKNNIQQLILEIKTII